MGEIDGEVYRLETTKVFQHEQQETKVSGGIKKTSSQIMLALQKEESKGEEEPTISVDTESSTLKVPEVTEKRGLPRVRSGSNLAALVVE
jgi:hypothetical protein